MENKVRFKLHKVKKHWITIAASSLAIGASLIGLGQVVADEVKPETTAVNSPENVVSDSNLETSASLITRTEVAPASTTVENTSSETVSTDTASTNAVSQPAEATSTQPASETDKKVETIQSGETTTTDRSTEVSSETSDNATTSQETPSQGGKFTSDDQGNWYYLDSDGHKLTGPQTIDNFNLYFHDNGIQAKGEKITIDGKDYYYDKDNGRKVTDTSIEVDGKTYLADADGILTEKTQLPTQVVTGGHFQSDNQKDWYYYTANGEKLTGWQNVDGVILYFDKDGKQVKGRFAEDGRYFDKDSGALVTKRYLETEDGNWVYVNDKGDKLKGEQTINGVKVYFDDFTGIQVKGHFAPNGKYYDKDSGALITNAFKEILTYIGRDDINNQNIYTTAWYYLDADGKPLTGPQTFGNSRFYFLPNGAQVKGRFAPDGHYYDKNSGALVTDSFVHVYNWNYRNLDGDRIFHFTITIPGNDLVDQDGQYPRESKDLDREDFYYYVDAKGDKLTGPQTLNGIHVYFDQNGRQLRGEFKFDDDGTVHYYDAKNGARAENTIVRTNTGAFKFDADGNGHLMGPDEV